MAKGWEKKNCYVVHAWYRDELYQENATPMKEEDVVLSYAEAERLKAEYESDPNFEEVYIEEDEREFWVDIEEKNVVPEEHKILEMAAKIEQNKEEDAKFKEILDKFEIFSLKADGSIRIGKTPLVLSLVGANTDYDLYIAPRAIIKIQAKEGEKYHAHEIDKTVMYDFLSELRNPIMVLNGSHKNSIVAVTSLKDIREKNLKDRERNIIISVELQTREKHFFVNKITSAYGRRAFETYLSEQLKLNNIIAVNKNKANEMLQSLGLQSPPEESFICYDDSIAYTLDNVNQKKEEKISTQDRNKQIAEDLRANKLIPTQSLVSKIKKLQQVTGKELSISDINDMYGTKQEPDVTKIINNIAKECKHQRNQDAPIP